MVVSQSPSHRTATGTADMGRQSSPLSETPSTQTMAAAMSRGARAPRANPGWAVTDSHVDHRKRGVSPNAGAFGVRQMERRIAQARQLFDDDVVAGHRYGGASKRPNFRHHLERRSESGDLGENLLGSANHLPVLDVVSGLVPRADQSPVLDRSARQVCAQMPTPPRDGEVFAVDVSNGIRSRTGHPPRGQVGNRAHCDLLCHASLQSPPTVLNTSLSTYPRPHAGKHSHNAADRNSDGISPG